MDGSPDKPAARPRRLSAFAVDQAIAGASNVLAAILAATTLGVTEFGEFGIAFLVYVVAQAILRALVAEPLLVHPEEADDDPGEALGSAIAIGLGLGALIVFAGLGAYAWYDGDLGVALLILGAAFPLLALQDVGRFVGFARQEPVLAIHLDLVWLILMVGVITGAAAFVDLTLAGVVLGWVGSGSVAGLLALWQHKRERVRVGLAWVRRCWTFSWRYLVSAATRQGGALAGALILAAIVSVAAVGAVQGALLVFRPFTTVQIAALTAGTAEIARNRPEDPELRRFAGKLSALVTGFALLNAAVLLLLPSSLGEIVLGDTWPATDALLVPAGITVLVMGAWTGAWAALLGDRAVRKTVALDLGFVPVLVATAAAGAALGGVEGYYWGVVAGQVVLTCATWATFLLHTGRNYAPAR